MLKSSIIRDHLTILREACAKEVSYEAEHNASPRNKALACLMKSGLIKWSVEGEAGYFDIGISFAGHATADRKLLDEINMVQLHDIEFCLYTLARACGVSELEWHRSKDIEVRFTTIHSPYGKRQDDGHVYAGFFLEDTF